ncbi:hypothetical protein CRG98_028199 [Punica granatum]|uniref:Uncharacterized protein n=1 Tax=Punica granatum TaxID=22663 RepID=A0A2I0J5S4_PUNGR|nr:hypothetical protein CRG98_028199 [Punica granatum]
MAWVMDSHYASYQSPYSISTAYSPYCPSEKSSRWLWCVSHGLGHALLSRPSISTSTSLLARTTTGKLEHKSPTPVIMTRLERMRGFIDRTMMRYQEQRLKIDKFNFHYYAYCLQEASNGFVQLVNKWIGIALDNNVQEISVVVLGQYFSPSTRFNILERILSALSVHSLKLVGMSLALSSFLDASLNLNSLRSHTLEDFPMDDHFFKRLTSRNRSLDSRKLSNNCFLCTKSHMVAVNQSPNLKSLLLADLLMTNEWFGEFLSRFSVLEDLTMDYCHSLRRIRILNPSIKRIDIIHCPELIDINLETPELTHALRPQHSRRFAAAFHMDGEFPV